MALPALLFALLAGQEAVSTAAPEPAPAAAAAATASQAEYTPEGAPRDDYNFVAWCHGVLSGHMALAERIQPVLPLDEVQQKIGKAYLKGYEEALAAGKGSRSAAELDAADAIRAAARANWNTAMKADIQLGADTYLAWQLPGRCEHAAKRIAGRADLFRMIPTPQENETVSAGAAVAEAPPPARTPVVATAPAPEVPAVTPASAPAAESAVPVFTSADMTTSPEPAAPEPVAAPAEAPVSAVFTTAETEAPAAEPETVAAAAPAESETETAEAPKPAEEASTGDRRIVRMPSKGRLFPWGKRE